jgi:hypothetical protein
MPGRKDTMEPQKAPAPEPAGDPNAKATSGTPEERAEAARAIAEDAARRQAGCDCN